MPTYYVSSAGSNTSPYDTWAKAATDLQTALTAASTSGDVVLVDKEHQETFSASKTFTFANNVSVICVDKDNSDALSIMDGTAGYIGDVGDNLTFAGAYKVFVYGLYFKHNALTVCNTDGAHHEFELCEFDFANNSSADFFCGVGGSGNGFMKMTGCTFNFQNASSTLFHAIATPFFEGCTFTGTVGSPFLADGDRSSAKTALFVGCDLSNITGTLVNGTAAQQSGWNFVNCKLGTGVTILGTSTPANLSGAEVNLYNCSTGDNHYEFGHYNAFGSTVAVTSPYISDGALYDGTNNVTWKIVTSADCSYYTPYVSPWIETYHSGASAITPSIEGLMIDDSTVATNAEVWGEFSYQGTSGFTIATIVNDRQTLLGSPSNQTSSKTYSDWTASPATDSGDSVFKLATTATITPAEIGMLRARVCVGEASKTLYIDPKIRT